jgi:predicted nucleic acid-binding protein
MASLNAHLRVAASDTGPLISAFQCGRTDLLRSLYDGLHIPPSVRGELNTRESSLLLDDLIASRFVAVRELTDAEKRRALVIARQIADSPFAKSKTPLDHYPEAEAIALAPRSSPSPGEVLLDERAARAVAQSRGVAVVGFPGLLIRAHRRGLLTAEAARDALSRCRDQGTRYSDQLVEEVYERLSSGAP